MRDFAVNFSSSHILLQVNKYKLFYNYSNLNCSIYYSPLIFTVYPYRYSNDVSLFTYMCYCSRSACSVVWMYVNAIL